MASVAPSAISDIQNRLCSTDPLVVDAAIVDCFEVGYFPWDLAEFRICLYGYLHEQIFTPDQHFLRGIIFSRYVAGIMPDGVDDSIKSDLTAWGNGALAQREYPDDCSWPRSNWPRQNKIASPWCGVAFWAATQTLHNCWLTRQMKDRKLTRQRSKLRAHLGLS